MMIDEYFDNFLLEEDLEEEDLEAEDLEEEDLEAEDLEEEDLEEEDLEEDSEEDFHSFQIYNTYSLQSSDSFLNTVLDDLNVSDISSLLIFSFCVFVFINFWIGGGKNVRFD